MQTSNKELSLRKVLPCRQKMPECRSKEKLEFESIGEARYSRCNCRADALIEIGALHVILMHPCSSEDGGSRDVVA